MSTWSLHTFGERHWTLEPVPKRRPRSPAKTYGLTAGPKPRVPRGTVRVGHRMMIATRTFSATVDGHVERVVAGRDYINAGHPIVRKHPENFRPAPAHRRHALRSVIRPADQKKAA